MRFGTFYEHQIAQPWEDGDEAQLFEDALEQVELADKLGFGYVWEVEHHFLEEYSHSSAPEVFLAAASQRTENIRLGHGIKLMPPGYNAPARAAEQLATLDIVSGGRVEWGTGESSSRTELEGFGIAPEDRRKMWLETTRETARMMSMHPYPGYAGEFFSMPPRNVVPKPVQRPHPPLWVACSNRQTIKLAAKLGIGALTFSFLSPEEAQSWVDEYYTTFKQECTPLGESVNPNIAMVTGFGCHADKQTAIDRFQEGFHFFQFALGHYYMFGRQRPAETSIWDNFVAAGKPGFNLTAIEQFDTPDNLREYYRRFEDTGVDQIVFIQQGGRNRHDHICEALELFAETTIDEFTERDEARRAAKEEELAPFVEAALARKAAESAARTEAAGDYEIPAYGLDGAIDRRSEDDIKEQGNLVRAPGVD